ncbi:MAG TPA: methionine--tRNA ligase subunit beta, partial [Bacteroidota bacterium]
ALNAPEILVAKIENSAIEALVQSLGGNTEKQTKTDGKPMITIDDFKKIDLRLAKVISAERIPKSEKLLKLRVQVGGEERQVIAGIAQHYQPEQLVGRLIVVVANLQPVKLMGEESQGMLLAANGPDGGLSIVTIDQELEPGSIVR